METSMLVLSALVLVLVSACVMLLLRWLWPDAGLQRLSAQSAADATAASVMPSPSWNDRLPPRLRKVLAGISRWSLPQAPQPTEAQKTSSPRNDLPLQLVRAGWRSAHAMWLFGASKSVLTVLGFTLGGSWAWLQGWPVLGWEGLSLTLGLAAVGYWLPNAWMHACTTQRQQQLFRAFPDALDMLRICVQAGLGLDAAIERVGREMKLSSPALSEEWRLTGLELRAGASRRMALQHMAERVGLSEVHALVTMLIQADRFGTRMSDALQVHADVLRTQRKHKAETEAAQLPVKLLIPLIFCIFPALLTVMMGPVGLSLYEHFSGKG